MSNYKHQKPKDSLIAALDIGSVKVSCFIAKLSRDGTSYDVVGVGHQPAKGIQNGIISDLNAAETVIRQAVHAAENMAAAAMRGYPLRRIVVNVPANHVFSHMQSIDIKIAGHEVVQLDIQRALQRAQQKVKASAHDQDLIHTIPMRYRMNGQEDIQDPVGMHAKHIEADIHIVTADSTATLNTTTCVERSYLDISAFCSSAYAAGLSSLVDDEMDLGATLIDLGGGITSIAVFRAGHMIYNDYVPLGGQHVTNDIAHVLTTSVQDAERIKKLYGSAVAGQSDAQELIDVPKLGEVDRTALNHVPKSILVGIIQPRLEEIFEMARGKLKDSGLEPYLGRRVVLTGGASQLHGMKELAEQVLDKQVRLGYPMRLTGLPDAVSGPAFATTAGLLIYAATRMHEVPEHLDADAGSDNMLKNIALWIKENW